MTETSFSATTEPGTLVLSGDIDAADHRALNDLIEQASATFTENLTIDLRGVTFLPSIIVGVLARATVMAKKNGARVTLVAVEGTVPQRVLTVCKIPYEQVTA
ncbi:STAS domain-containing protein [Nocardioides sp. ChNu-153]|uniref:STAS domain-containing protein n=1 Tax=unclassified Nocardioides TaxID=2615069 RepID=UPI002406FAAB|nr:MULTISPECIES: STAS domain-containing protein [unclassified Nocardioides]MDF9717854.1 STAS domain-containing protein [Nocardioides sp. ChNu-99]MDN7121434.1 STAS domain-containing protein [Nocardioides sp. ChNu-153]